MSEETFKAYCKTCQAADDCRRAFGKYYEDKSRGGVGCNCPFPGYRHVPSEPLFTTQSKPNRKGK